MQRWVLQFQLLLETGEKSWYSLVPKEQTLLSLSLSLSLSLQAKVEVVLGVFKIGREIGIESICVESESKVFVDALVFLCQGIP